jgi:putative endopeptidase
MTAATVSGPGASLQSGRARGGPTCVKIAPALALNPNSHEGISVTRIIDGALRAGCVFALTLVAGCLADSQSVMTDQKATASGVELANFEKSVRPQDDFYRHVNGHWLDTAQIPADKASYGSFTQLYDLSQERLRTIIEESANKGDKKEGTDEQKVGDLYASYMDEARADELGIKPLEAEILRIKALKSAAELPALMAHLGRINVTTPIGGYVNQDAKDPDQYIVYLVQSGLGLPDRDYYLLPDEKFKALRAQYVTHIEKTLRLAGDKNAANNAKAIMALETRLAQKQWNRVDSRDDDKTYNKYEIAKLKTLGGGFDWAVFCKEAGITSKSLIVSQPSAFTGFTEQVEKTPLAVWRAYLRYHLIDDYAPLLSKDFVDENFAFNRKALRGIEENRPRWKRGVQAVEDSIGESVGKIYVARYFPPEAKARMEKLVANLIEAYRQSITQLDWMSDETKQKALAKLAKFSPKIGYPNKWRDYSELSIKKDDLVGNLMRAAQNEYNFQIGKLGKPIDREEWLMTPQTVNAYYLPNKNEIVFPAAILQPPFFNLEAEDAVNYGGIGAVIGHEIGHGFDDQGSKYDGDGMMQSWWGEEDRKKFETRTQALIEQYNQYEPIKGFKVNGALTIGENIGDLGGASIAYKAYQLSLAGKPAPVLDGYTGDQRFFIGWAQIWRNMYREPALIELVKTNPHSPSEFRCKGPLQNLPEFYAAFDVKEGDPMYLPPEKRVKIW